MKRQKYLILLLLFTLLAINGIRFFFPTSTSTSSPEQIIESDDSQLSAQHFSSPSKPNKPAAPPARQETAVRDIFLQGQAPNVQVNVQWQRSLPIGEEYLVLFNSPDGPSSLRALVDPDNGRVIRTWAASHRKEGLREGDGKESAKLEITGVL